ncbi:MAG: DUF1501 domain-containing protein [Phycisphaerales bacterium]|nr:DUF1501 domain-containing protein [Phycisphaerales bacterium]
MDSGCGHSRRSFLKVGVLSGLALPELLRLEAFASGASEAKATSVIHIFLSGGMAHQETFDPKPYTPVEYRGAIETVDTAIPGVRFGSRLAQTARVADRLTVIRSFTHGEAAHERGVHNMFTGYRPSPALVYPSMGSIVAHEQGPRKQLPAYVCVPDVPNVYAGTGYLGAACAPFSVGADPASKTFEVRDLAHPAGIDGARATRRRSLLEAVNEHFRARETSDHIDAMDAFYQRAYDMLASPHAREAFNLRAEPDALRDSYGRHAAGQRLLLARRLVEAGVRFVSLEYGGWDMHQDINGAMNRAVPPLDQAYAMLIRDLDERGLLDSTLVLLTTEFGRTPKLNPDGGRDHWPRVYSIAMAGGGVKRGYVHGRSDSTASEVEEHGVGPESFARTVFSLMGIDPDKSLMAPGNRPVRIVSGGSMLTEILA